MAIGVFDSGVGGLTVHHALVRRLPRADLIYLADQANTPYGGKPGAEIVELTKAGCIRLFDEGCSLVVLACNTAAARNGLTTTTSCFSASGKAIHRRMRMAILLAITPPAFTSPGPASIPRRPNPVGTASGCSCSAGSSPGCR